MKKTLNIALLISFIVTNMVPLTGIHIHKMASLIFLLLCILHTIVYRKKMGAKRWLILGAVVAAFLTGIFGMVFENIPLVLAMHKTISIVLVFFLAIHIFIFHKRLKLVK